MGCRRSGAVASPNQCLGQLPRTPMLVAMPPISRELPVFDCHDVYRLLLRAGILALNLRSVAHVEALEFCLQSLCQLA